MNVLVGMQIPVPALHRAGGLCISGVDFGCFSTFCGDCEALVEREEQMNFTLLILCLILKNEPDHLII